MRGENDGKKSLKIIFLILSIVALFEIGLVNNFYVNREIKKTERKL